KLHLGPRPHAAQGGADGRAHDRLLGDRGVAATLVPEGVQHPGGDPERASVDADVLAEHEHPLVSLHGLGEGGPDGLGEGQGLDLGLGGGHGASASPLAPAAAATGAEPDAPFGEGWDGGASPVTVRASTSLGAYTPASRSREGGGPVCPTRTASRTASRAWSRIFWSSASSRVSASSTACSKRSMGSRWRQDSISSRVRYRFWSLLEWPFQR